MPEAGKPNELEGDVNINLYVQRAYFQLRNIQPLHTAASAAVLSASMARSAALRAMGALAVALALINCFSPAYADQHTRHLLHSAAGERSTAARRDLAAAAARIRPTDALVLAPLATATAVLVSASLGVF